jgi:pimeloyl-ACP methyl ester carboxylesterase
MHNLGWTPSFRDPDGERLAGSIAEIQYLQLGGVEQWVMIRGESITNPPLILLHGGPGLSETGLFRYFNAPLEKSFTVVYWDQRGAGKSFNPSIPRSSMTVEQFIADLDELVEVVLARLGKTKVTIFGHSWGSILGVLYATRSPQKVAAHVGSGQIGDWAASEAASYAIVLDEARRAGNRKAVDELLAIGPPPYSAQSLWTERMWIQRLEGQLSVKSLPTFRALRWSIDAMWAECSTLNLLELAPVLQVPVFFFLGRNDHWVPPETSLAYFNALTAPSKRLLWFERSGHEPFMDEPDAFNEAMKDLVLPVASAGPI